MQIFTGIMMMIGGVASLVVSLPCRASDKALTEIVIGLPSASSLNYCMFTAAMDLGYFAQEGIKLRLQELQGGAVVMSQVATQAIPIGAGTPDPLVIANQPGRKRLPLKFFYNQTREYNWEFVVPVGSGIKSISGLRGKKIGVGALTNSHMPVSRMILKGSGLQQNRDYQLIGIGAEGPAFKALLDGRVDAYITYSTNRARFETLAGAAQLRALPIADKFQTLFQNGFFAHEDAVRDRPQMLIGFGRATAKATIFCRRALDFCIRSYWRHFPNLKPRTGTEEENARKLAQALQEPWNAYFAFPAGQAPRFGEYPAEAWKTLVGILQEGGEVATMYDPGLLYTNDLITRINDFDHAAIEKQAVRPR